MKRLLLILLVVLIIGCAALGFLYLYNPRKALLMVIPDLRDLKKIALQIKGDSLFAKPQLILENKSIFRIHILQLEMNLNLENERLLSVKEYKEIDLQPGDSLFYTLPIRLPLQKLRNKIDELQGKDSASIYINGAVTYKTLVGKVEVPVELHIRISVPIPPQIEIEGIKLTRLNFKSPELLLELKIKNPGKLDLQFSNVKMNAVIEKDITLKEKKTINFHLKGKSEEKVLIPLLMELKNPITALRILLNRKTPVDYKVQLTGELRADSLYDGEIPVVLKTSGQKILKKP